MKCANCGSENPSDYKFCGSCGATLPAAPAASASTPTPYDDASPYYSPYYGSDPYDDERARRNKRLVLIGGAVGVAGVAIIACLGCVLLAFIFKIPPFSQAGASPTASVSQGGDSAAAGWTASGADYTLIITKMERVKALDLKSGDSREAKGSWLILYATIRNTSKQSIAINDTDFELSDDVGDTYRPSTGYYITTFLGEKKLASLNSQFAAGAATKAALVFDIDPDAQGLALKIKSTNDLIDFTQQ